MKTDFWKSVARLAAPESWDASFTPMLVGFTCAFTIGGAKLTRTGILWMLFAFAAIGLVETGKHALNEILDYRRGADRFLAEDHMTPVSGGKKVLREGLATERQCWLIAFVTLGIACAAGLVICVCLDWKILLIGILGMAMAVLYNEPHIGLIYRGFGEACIFIAYGPVCTMGAWYMFVPEFSPVPFLLSISLGFLIVNVLLINEFPDYEADLAAGKRNWIVRLGKEKGVRLYEFLFLLHFVPLIFLSFYYHEMLFLLPSLNSVLFYKIYMNLRENKNCIPKLIKSNLDTITVHSRCGLFMNTALVLIWLMK